MKRKRSRLPAVSYVGDCSEIDRIVVRGRRAGWNAEGRIDRSGRTGKDVARSFRMS